MPLPSQPTCSVWSLCHLLTPYHPIMTIPLAPPPFQKFNIITPCVTLLLLQAFHQTHLLFDCLILSFHIDICLLLKDSPRFTRYLAAIFRLRHAENAVITQITWCHFQKILIAASPKSAHFWASNAQEFTPLNDRHMQPVIHQSDCMKVIGKPANDEPRIGNRTIQAILIQNLSFENHRTPNVQLFSMTNPQVWRIDQEVSSNAEVRSLA